MSDLLELQRIQENPLTLSGQGEKYKLIPPSGFEPET